MKKLVKISLVSALMFSSSIVYAKSVSTKVHLISSTQKDKKQLIDIAGKQRMLSQRIAKDYLYKGKKVATTKASKELKSSFGEFLTNQKKLKESINDDEIKNLLEFTQMSSQDFQDLMKEGFSSDNAQIAIDLSESMLEGSQYVVDSLKKAFKMNSSGIIAKSGKQRMLAQRIAKYYIAYQSGIKDKNTVDQMKAAVKEFSDNLKFLQANKSNSPTINKKLNDVTRLWDVVYKFYLNIEKGGLPFIVFKSTNDITKKMNEITKLYVGS